MDAGAGRGNIVVMMDDMLLPQDELIVVTVKIPVNT